MYRKSVKRDQIFQYLNDSTCHPTAEEIFSVLKKQFPKISFGSIYRNLNILIEQGKVKKVDFNDTQDRFEAVKEHHYHFICESCSRIIDISLPLEKILEKKLAKTADFTIKRHTLTFYGLCQNCR